MSEKKYVLNCYNNNLCVLTTVITIEQLRTMDLSCYDDIELKAVK